MNRLPNISLPGSYMSCFVLKASEEKRDPNRGTFLSCRSLAHFAPPVREEKLRKTPRDMIQSLETLRLQSTSPIGTYRVASPTRSILSYSEYGISWSESMLNDFTLGMLCAGTLTRHEGSCACTKTLVVVVSTTESLR